LTYNDVYIGRLGEGCDPLDWGAWAADVSKRQISDFLDTVYPTDPADSDRMRGEMRDFIRGLPDGRYALVASEL
jgi:hypothetical protein